MEIFLGRATEFLRHFCFALFGLCATGCVTCLDKPADLTPTVKHLLSEDDVTILDFSIGKSSLTQIVSILGKAPFLPMQEQGPNRICYASPSGKVRLIFEAGPMGGWEEITSFTISSGVADSDYKEMCVTTPKISEHIATASGLSLSMSKEQIKERFGNPTSETSEKLRYVQHTSILRRGQSGESEELFQSSYVDVWFENSVIISIHISRIDST